MELPPEYLRGIELFNEGRYFECHEAWEIVWLRAEGIEKEFLHSLILAAAALHHFNRGNRKGAASIFERASRICLSLPPLMMGLETHQFARHLDEFFAANPDPQFTIASLPEIRLHL